MLFNLIMFWILLPFTLLLWLSMIMMFRGGLKAKTNKEQDNYAESFVKAGAYTLIFSIFQALIAQSIWG